MQSFQGINSLLFHMLRWYIIHITQMNMKNLWSHVKGVISPPRRQGCVFYNDMMKGIQMKPFALDISLGYNANAANISKLIITY